MDGDRDKAVGFGHAVTALHTLAHPDHHARRPPGVLTQREDDLVGKGEATDRAVGGERLEFRRVHAMPEPARPSVGQAGEPVGGRLPHAALVS
jgi:hypothetical protein